MGMLCMLPETSKHQTKVIVVGIVTDSATLLPEPPPLTCPSSLLV